MLGYGVARVFLQILQKIGKGSQSLHLLFIAFGYNQLDIFLLILSQCPKFFSFINIFPIRWS
jgi:hypothetical protein